MASDPSRWDVLIPVDSTVLMTSYVQDGYAASSEHAEVSQVANSLLDELTSPGPRR